MEEGVGSRWYPQRGRFYPDTGEDITDSSRIVGERHPPVRSKSVLVTDIPPQLSTEVLSGNRVQVGVHQRKPNGVSTSTAGETEHYQVSRQRISHTQAAPPLHQSALTDEVRHKKKSSPVSHTQPLHIHQKGVENSNLDNREYQRISRVQAAPPSHLRSSTEEIIHKTGSHISHSEPLHIDLGGINSSNITRAYSIESPVTPTKYTYNYTASFDSGISELDLTKPQSPLNRSQSTIKEVPTHQSSMSAPTRRGQEKDPRFLKKVQRELDDQRSRWEHEVDQLSDSVSKVSVPTGDKVSQQGQNSYVDTSSGRPIFKAFVDLSAYPKKGISVNVDSLLNKVIITAAHDSVRGNVTRTFTQKVALPRYSDEQMLTSHLSKNGILKIEVPLFYYFERTEDAKARDRKAKSFVYQVEANGSGGGRVLEILVNTGAEFRAKELKILVQDDNKLLVMGERSVSDKRTGQSHREQKLIKQYTLPDYADVDHITSKLGKDGRLQVNVPLMKD